MEIHMKVLFCNFIQQLCLLNSKFQFWKVGREHTTNIVPFCQFQSLCIDDARSLDKLVFVDWPLERRKRGDCILEEHNLQKHNMLIQTNYGNKEWKTIRRYKLLLFFIWNITTSYCNVCFALYALSFSEAVHISSGIHWEM